MAQINEIGFFVGGSNYIGDIGNTKFIRANAPAFGFIYKFNKDPRIAYRTTLTNMTIHSSSANSNNEVRESFEITIDKKITELTAGIEFNFFEYNIASKKQSNSPYFIFELAAFQYKKAISLSPNINPADGFNYKTKWGLALPFGIGYKSKLYDKFAFALETRIRYTFTDDLDDGQFYKDHDLIKGEKSKFNNSSTNDWYLFTGISIVYTFGRPTCY